MATLTLTIPDDKAAIYVNALCKRAGFEGGTAAERKEVARKRVAQLAKADVLEVLAEDTFTNAMDERRRARADVEAGLVID